VGGHIDAAVTHDAAEIIVPVGAVKSHACFRLKEAHPGNAGQFIGFGIGGQCSIAHVARRGFALNVKFTFGGFGGNIAGFEQAAVGHAR